MEALGEIVALAVGSWMKVEGPGRGNLPVFGHLS